MSIEHPYGDIAGITPLKGNLHTHTTRSDGKFPAQDMIDGYAEKGYDFLMISDHDIYTSPEELGALDAKGLVLIPGNEVSAAGPHLLHVNAGTRIAPHPRRQEVLNDITASGQGFSVLCHPNWKENFDHISLGQMQEWTGYVGMEIYNGCIRFHHGSPVATNKWDMLLTGGRRVWGFANDDSHRLADIGFGWNMVYAREKSAAGILTALQKGQSYLSTGVVISSITVEGTRIRVETENADTIFAMHQTARRFAQASGNVIEVEVPEIATYVRFECWGRGEQMAWTQPFFITKAAAL